MSLTEELIKRLEAEGIPTYSMSESELKRANEILKELVEDSEA